MGFFTKTPPCDHDYIVTAIRYVKYAESHLTFNSYTYVAAVCTKCHEKLCDKFAGKLSIDTAKKLYDDRTPKEREVYIDE